MRELATWLALILGLGLASARLTRLAVEDTIFDRPREYLAGLNWWLEKLLECPWCASAYTTAALVGGAMVVTSVPLPVAAYFAAWQVAVTAFWVTELAFSTYKAQHPPQKPPSTL